MNKKELINEIASQIGLTKVEAKRLLETVLTVTNGALKSGDVVRLVGFGTFSIKQRKARKGRNPQTGETIHIKAKKVVKFKPSANLL